MDVLNTFGGGVNGLAIFLTIVLGLFAIMVLVYAIIEIEAPAILVGLVLAIFAIGIATEIPEPVRHEVTLRPGYVIDATKYEIVEQRGQIYVIEERKGAE